MALLTFTSQNFRFKGDLVAGLGHVAFFFQCSPARLVTGGYLRSFFFFRSCRVVTGRPWTEARRNCVPSNARQTQHGQVGVRGGCTRDGGTTAAVGKQVHHTAQACPSSEESGTTHQERPYVLTKRHTTPALVGADRKKASRPSLSLPATHTRALAPDQCPRRTKPRLQHAHSRIILRCIATCTDLNLSHEEGPLPRRRQ